jgi:hypothetical protein
MMAPAPLPPPVVERHGPWWLVRDDRIVGGTKRRVLPLFFDGTHREYVYASPAYGYAQVALAASCRDYGLQATVFVAQRRVPYRHTQTAADLGAQICTVPYGYLSNVQAKARAYAVAVGARLVPFGLDDERVVAALATCAAGVAAQVGPVPELWTVAGSGVVSRALQRAWPGVPVHAVQIGHALDDRQRGRARVHVAPERFEQEARDPPPFPSCGNYDAKAWRFIGREAVPGALFWNVAG